MSQIQRFLIERITVDLIETYMSEFQVNFDQATSTVFSSELHVKLTDPETGLYLDSSASIYELFTFELQHGAIIQNEQ
jgi:hypothetical protein